MKAFPVVWIKIVLDRFHVATLQSGGRTWVLPVICNYETFMQFGVSPLCSSSLCKGLTPSTWRHLLPVAMTMWLCMMGRTLQHLCWEYSVVQCSHLIFAPLRTSSSLSLGQMPLLMGSAGGLLTVRHLVGQCYSVCEDGVAFSIQQIKCLHYLLSKAQCKYTYSNCMKKTKQVHSQTDQGAQAMWLCTNVFRNIHRVNFGIYNRKLNKIIQALTLILNPMKTIFPVCFLDDAGQINRGHTYFYPNKFSTIYNLLVN